MALFSRKAPKRKLRAIFDIADSGVNVAVVSTEAARPRLIWSHHEPLEINNYKDNEAEHQSVLNALTKAINRLRTDGFAAVEKAGFNAAVQEVAGVLSAPWQLEEVVSSRLKKADPFRITDEHVSSARQLAHQSFLRRVRERGQHSGRNLNHFSQRITAVQADGQPVDLSYKEPVRDLRLRMHISKIPKKTHERIRRVFGQSFHPNILSFHSATDLISRVLTRTFTHPQDFLIISPSRHGTSSWFVENGELEGVTSHAIGEDFLFRTSAAALDRTIADIQSRLSLKRQVRLHANQEPALVACLKEIGRRFQTLLLENIDQITSGQPPRHVYLMLPAGTAGDIFQNFFAETMQELEGLEVHVITSDLLASQFHASQPIHPRLACGILGTGEY